MHFKSLHFHSFISFRCSVSLTFILRLRYVTIGSLHLTGSYFTSSRFDVISDKAI